MEKQAFTLAEFCQAYNISRGRLHELDRAGLGPKTYRIASRPYVSLAAAKEWQQRMEEGDAVDFKPLPPMNPGCPGRAAKSCVKPESIIGPNALAIADQLGAHSGVRDALSAWRDEMRGNQEDVSLIEEAIACIEKSASIVRSLFRSK